MTVYYNEYDPQAAAWLRELIRRNLIASGDVDDRSIEDVEATDLRGYTQCHFFAGIGTWSYALRNAGWPDDRPVWTGSPPCQPFSAAGRRQGYDDKRHLAPKWLDLIRECRPPVVFGEQVSSAFGKEVQAMRRDKAVYRILREFIERQALSALELQSLSSQLSKITERVTEREGELATQRGQGDLLVADGETEGKRKIIGVHDYQGPNPENAGRRGVQRNAYPFRYGGEARLGHALSGSDQAGEGIYAEELPASSVLRERDDARLGRGFNFEDCCGDVSEAAEALYRLTIENREAVNGKIAPAKHPWIDDLQDALEAENYATGKIVLPACGVGAPHIRQRGWFVAERVGNASKPRLEGLGRGHCPEERQRQATVRPVAETGESGRVEHPGSERRQRWEATAPGHDHDRPAPERTQGEHGAGESGAYRIHQDGTRPPDAFWRSADWLFCRDGKWRPVESGTFPLVDGTSARVGRLRGYGNGIVAQVATEVILAYTGDYWLT